MTLGEKIRYFRELRGFTQKELGIKVGFSASTADSRIRKYENNIMAPKTEIPTLPFNDELNLKLRKWAEINKEYGSMALLKLDPEKKKEYIDKITDCNNEFYE